jgi:heptosyltransferase III
MHTANFKRILIVATRQIGDVLLTTPIIRSTQQFWPDAVIDVLGYERTMGMLTGNPDLNDVIEFAERPSWPEYKQLLRRIFRKYDLAIVTQASDRAHIYGFLAAPRRIGIVPPNNRHAWWKKKLCEFSVQMAGADRHVIVDRARLIDGYVRLLGLADLKRHAYQPTLVPPKAEALPCAVESNLVRPYVVIHATPMWRYKQWPISQWVQLTEALLTMGHSVVLSGSGAMSDLAVNGLIQSGVSSANKSQIIDLTGRLTLGQLTTLLSGAKAYIGVDTSITHQAAAVGTPTVALFGPTSPVYFGPWPQGAQWESTQDSVWQRTAHPHQRIGNVTIVQGTGSCVPCMRAGCDDHNGSHSLCLDQLNHQTVLDAMRDVI